MCGCWACGGLACCRCWRYGLRCGGCGAWAGDLLAWPAGVCVCVRPCDLLELGADDRRAGAVVLGRACCQLRPCAWARVCLPGVVCWGCCRAGLLPLGILGHGLKYRNFPRKNAPGAASQKIFPLRGNSRATKNFSKKRLTSDTAPCYISGTASDTAPCHSKQRSIKFWRL